MFCNVEHLARTVVGAKPKNTKYFVAIKSLLVALISSFNQRHVLIDRNLISKLPCWGKFSRLIYKYSPPDRFVPLRTRFFCNIRPYLSPNWLDPIIHHHHLRRKNTGKRSKGTRGNTGNVFYKYRKRVYYGKNSVLTKIVLKTDRHKIVR